MKTTVEEQKVADYNNIFDEKSYSKRSPFAQKVTDSYYDLMTQFYESGWGESFHFAPRYKGEDLKASIVRHEHYLAVKLGLSPKDIVLDAGCGVMGPARNIARVAGSHIIGLTINRHQVERCNELNNKTSVSHLLSAKQGDFMDIPYPDNYFDKIYAIEALCHAPDLVAVYKQIYSKLKPGGKACLYEWAMTDKFDPGNAKHLEVKKMIEYGNSICELKTIAEINEAIQKAGFIKEETLDLATANSTETDIPWYSTLQSGLSFSHIRHTKVSRTIVHYLLSAFEFSRLIKAGVSKTHKILLMAADGLVAGGEMGIFTPMYLVLLRKGI